MNIAESGVLSQQEGLTHHKVSTFFRILRSLRTLTVLFAILLPLFFVIHYMGYWMRMEGQIGTGFMQVFWSTVGWFVAAKLVVFAWFGVHRGWGRFHSFYDLINLIKAATCATVITVLVNRFVSPQAHIPRGIFLLDWGTTIVIIGGIRSLIRMIHEGGSSLLAGANRIPAFIVGADDCGESLLRTIIRDESATYRVVGFIDDDRRRLGMRIGGVRVIGSLEETCELAARYDVREVLIATDELSGRQIRTLVEDARQHSISVKVLPSFEQLIKGNLSLHPRPVAIEDLLQRKPVELDMKNIRKWIDHRVLLVTGSAGSIGSEICRQLLKYSPQKLVLVDRSENGQFFLERELRQRFPNVELDVCIADILDRRRMEDVLQQYQPDVIFHAAAYKHVPLMEDHPGEAVKNIVVATQQLADLAVSHGVESFVMISTDKAVNPTSVMGACKRVAELYVQSLSDSCECRFVTVRFGNVLDSAGSVVQVFREQIARGGPVSVTDPEMQRYFMTIPEASRLVIQAGSMGKSGQILVLDMGEPVKIVDLAADMIRLSGLRVGEDVEIEYVGLRPGEKLYEELRSSGEKLLPTIHEKITVAAHRPCDLQQILAAIDDLKQSAAEAPEQVIAKLQMIVPEYCSEQLAGSRPRIAAA